MQVPPQKPVDFDQWCEEQRDHLLDLYEYMQDVSQRTGRMVFDRSACSFAVFCLLAYRNSSLYQKPEYHSDHSEDEN